MRFPVFHFAIFPRSAIFVFNFFCKKVIDQNKQRSSRSICLRDTVLAYSSVLNKANIQNKTNIGPDSQKLIKLTYGIKANIGPVLQKLIKLTYRIKN